MSDDTVKRAVREIQRHGLQLEMVIELLESIKLTPAEFQRARRALNVAARKAYPPIVWTYIPNRPSGNRRHAWRPVRDTPFYETACNMNRALSIEDIAAEAAKPWADDDRRCVGCKSSLSSGRYSDPLLFDGLPVAKKEAS